ncbi:MAG: UDP-N-acetylmuramoyl-L-alanyl-D-glutamate--2,6-diaminopimelate ligase [Clostridia bacterium]|nr:UDP-N-acetylmuramoyl-L-alanyl-D-glutamate--2,6-diaminopimelate ligase [Clostridia bacterium]
MRRSYSVKEYIDLLDREGVLASADEISCADAVVENLCFDSRLVCEGTLFVCKGASFKEEYIAGAKEKGAIAFVSEIKYNVPNLILVKDIRLAMGLLSNMFFTNPWADFPLVAFTGTKGKSTSLSYLVSIMENAKVCGENKFGYISTIDTYDGKEKFKSHLTTPESIELGLRLRNIADSGLYAAGMEVSSQALKYHRSYGVEFAVGCFTNFGPDHVGSGEHTDIEDYLHSKLMLFNQCKTIVVNLDSDRIEDILPAAKRGRICTKLITFSAKDESADYFISNVRKEDGMVKFNLSNVGEIALTMPGLFNSQNAAAAAIVAKEIGATNEEIISGLLNARVPGRMDIFENKKRELVVITDYAHNGLSFETLFKSCNEEYPGYRIEAVFGSPGDKAYSRREELPAATAKFADFAYLTEDDPGHEDPAEICKILYENLTKLGGKGKIIVDRTEAIKEAIKNAPPKTVVLIMAKGREEYMKRVKLDPIKSDYQLVSGLIDL